MLYSWVAGLCTFLGAVVVFFRPGIGKKDLSFFLGLATGVMIAVVLVDLIPASLVRGQFRGFLWGAAWGGGIIAMINLILNGEKESVSEMTRIGYLIMLGIALHDLPEGMAIAIGYEVSTKTAMAIALGIGIHNIPEGMAIAAPLLMAGQRRSKIACETLGVAVVTPLGAMLGNAAVHILPQYFGVFMGLAGGVMLYLVWAQLWPQAKKTNSRWRYPGLVCGIAVIAVATLL
jgi:ZIP family zinc transporter